MISPLDRIKAKNKEFSEDDLIELRHDIMQCYGWISLQDFLKIPMVEIFQLNEFIQKDKKRRFLEYAAIRALGGVKKNMIISEWND